ncbi:hypothetical protein [Thermotoga profunda]|uniref:hypothetical protein n=1 Tax=Thermotoga profunda TaxID=1508420 RepID=UPI001494515D|nr:hypothetical protein [Thermotoga profunda]
MIDMTTYKAQLFGMKVKLAAYGIQNNPNGRNYKCKNCGFEYHCMEYSHLRGKQP